MKHYRIDCEPVYRRNNRKSYEYRSSVVESVASTTGEVETRKVWETTTKLRRDAIRLAKDAVKAFKAAEPIAWKPRSERPGVTRIMRSSGMAGKRQTPEARAAISRAMKAKWERGEMTGALKGRPTNAERAARDGCSPSSRSSSRSAIGAKSSI
jgi:hypothetical protein